MLVNKVNVTSEFCEECGEVVEKIQLEGIATCEYEKYDAHEFIGGEITLCNCNDYVFAKEEKVPEFGGAFYYDDYCLYIKEVIYDNPSVIVIWSDGTKTRSTCEKGDTWNPEFGLLLAVVKKNMCSSERIGKLFDDWAITSDTNKSKITLKDVRRRHKEEQKVAKRIVNAITEYKSTCKESKNCTSDECTSKQVRKKTK